MRMHKLPAAGRLSSHCATRTSGFLALSRRSPFSEPGMLPRRTDLRRARNLVERTATCPARSHKCHVVVSLWFALRAAVLRLAVSQL